jgi:hypothetical protein
MKRYWFDVWPEQGSALDADLNNVTGIIKYDLCRWRVCLVEAYGKKAVNWMAVRGMPVAVCPNDPVPTPAEVLQKMSASGVIRFRCCSHDFLRKVPPDLAIESNAID